MRDTRLGSCKRSLSPSFSESSRVIWLLAILHGLGDLPHSCVCRMRDTAVFLSQIDWSRDICSQNVPNEGTVTQKICCRKTQKHSVFRVEVRHTHTNSATFYSTEHSSAHSKHPRGLTRRWHLARSTAAGTVARAQPVGPAASTAPSRCPPGLAARPPPSR